MQTRFGDVQMASPPVDALVDQIKRLPPDQQIELAQAVDRLTWSARWRAICERIEARVAGQPQLSDDEIDEEVREVRREKPLSARSSTHPS
jgi:hypothetical protein